MDIGNTRNDRSLHAALTGLATRQRVIGNNVANVDTPEFKASKVEFEQALRNAGGKVDGLKMLSVENAVPGPDDTVDLRPQVITQNHTTRRNDGNNVDVDQEMIELAQANITYSTVAQLMSGRMGILRTVISGGMR